MALDLSSLRRTKQSNRRTLLHKKHALAIRWFHWLNFPILFLMIWSGMLIYWANRVFTIPWFGGRVGPLFPDAWYHPAAPAWVPGFLTSVGQDEMGHPVRLLWNMEFRLAEGLSWHFFVAWLFAINGALYCGYLIFSGDWKKILPKPAAFKEAVVVVLHDLHLTKRELPIRKYNAAQQISYTSVIFLGFVMLVTGVAIYKPAQQAWLTQLIGGYTVARFIHFWTTIAFMGFFVVHVGQVVKTGWNNFRGMVTGYELVTLEEKEALETE